MKTSLHKIIIIFSFSALAIFIIMIIAGFVTGYEGYQSMGVAGFALSFLSLLIPYFFMYQEKIKSKKITWMWWLATLLFVMVTISFSIASNNDWIFLILLTGILASFILAVIVIRLFLFNPESPRGIIIAMTFILIGIVMKRMHWPLAGFILGLSSILMALGMYASGLGSLFMIPKNSFLKYASFIGGLLLAFAFMALLFKFQHWPGAGLLVMVFQIPVLLATLLFILVLPRSNYFEWSKLEKRILGRTMIPWIFFLTLVTCFYIFPKGTSFIFPSGPPGVSFEMYNNYQPENKNGLFPDN
ncbi:MAG: hypothetical protein U0T82_09185 [Bacteroidales bacterium]